jgi:hypothetical protein
VRARATQASSTSTSTDTKWWKKQSELWVDVHTEEEFYREISSGDRLVFVGKHPAGQHSISSMLRQC